MSRLFYGSYAGPVYFIGIAFTIWMAVDAIKRGHNYYWIWIILMFPPIGAIIYFFTEFNSAGFSLPFNRGVTKSDLRFAEAEVRRLDNAPSWLKYASLLRQRKDYSNALNAAHKAHEKDATDPKIIYELAQCSVLLKNWKDAELHLTQLVSKNNFDEANGVLALLAQVKYETGQYDDSRVLLEKLVARTSRAEHIHDLAIVQLHLGDKEGAIKSFNRIIDESHYVPRYLQHKVKPWVKKAKKELSKLDVKA